VSCDMAARPRHQESQAPLQPQDAPAPPQAPQAPSLDLADPAAPQAPPRLTHTWGSPATTTREQGSRPHADRCEPATTAGSHSFQHRSAARFRRREVTTAVAETRGRSDQYRAPSAEKPADADVHWPNAPYFRGLQTRGRTRGSLTIRERALNHLSRAADRDLVHGTRSEGRTAR
jgi:hypothetical protein